MSKKIKISLIGVILVSLLCGLLMQYSALFYKTPIGKVIKVTMLDSTDRKVLQEITVRILNTEKKGEEYQIKNEATVSSILTERYQRGDEVFLEYLEHSESVIITGVKRDDLVVMATLFFACLMILIGRKRGILALLSIVLNIGVLLLFLFCVIQYGFVLLFGCFAALLYIAITFILMHGLQKQSLASIGGSIVSLVISMAIACIVLLCIKKNGLDYDQMEYLTYIDPKEIFLFEILLGGLGAIMDIANTMTTAVNELLEKQPDMNVEQLLHSGMEIGKDIMGTMTNILLFVFLCGSIPQVVIAYCNQVSFLEQIKHYLSLELARTLTGCICVVLSIPISLGIAILFYRRKEVYARWKLMLH